MRHRGWLGSLLGDHLDESSGRRSVCLMLLLWSTFWDGKEELDRGSVRQRDFTTARNWDNVITS